MTDDKVIKIYTELMREDLLHTSDEGRTQEKIAAGLSWVLGPGGPHEIYELGDDGVLIFRDIVPGFKCYLSWIIWSHECYGAGIIRESRAKIEEVAARNKLVKIETQTADERVVRLARMLFFDIEGCRFDSFLRGKKLYDVTLLGRSFDREEV